MTLIVRSYTRIAHVASFGDMTRSQAEGADLFGAANSGAFKERLDGRDEGWYTGLQGPSLSFGGPYSDWREVLGCTLNPDIVERHGGGSLEVYARGAFDCQIMPVLFGTHWGDFKDRPFADLIYFSAESGAFGPNTCAKLARQFKKHKAAFDKGVAATVAGLGLSARLNGEYAGQCKMYYSALTAVFSFAAESGLVVFSTLREESAVSQ
jgi:hypothetical protein